MFAVVMDRFTDEVSQGFLWTTMFADNIVLYRAQVKENLIR